MSLFSEIKESAQGRELSIRWYQNRIKSLSSNRMRPTNIIRAGSSSGAASVRPTYGEMNLFQYLPEKPERLKYYDLFPLALPLVRHRDGFTGINFHYLPIPLRVKLLELIAGAFGDEDTQKINATYQYIRNMRSIKPTIRRYLFEQVNTLFLPIPLDDMLIGALLPVQRFRTGPLNRMRTVVDREVWRDSRRTIQNG